MPGMQYRPPVIRMSETSPFESKLEWVDRADLRLWFVAREILDMI
jgi:hypothetical protein